MTVLPDNNSEELLDVLDSNGTVVGTASREEVHERGLWHRTFHCLAVRSTLTDGEQVGARVVLQRRSLRSRTFPGCLDLTASGHLTAGETPRMGVRELTEETGVVVDPDRLVPLGVQILVDDRPGRLNREHVHVFLVVEDLPLADFAPNADEVEGLIEANSSDLLELFHRQRLGDENFVITARQLPSKNPSEIAECQLSIDDLIPGSFNYFVKVLIMAERHIRGEHPIAI